MFLIEDCIDIVLAKDEKFLEQVERLEEDVKLGINENYFQEALEDIFTESDCTGETHPDELPVYAAVSPVEEAATTYMEAYHELLHPAGSDDMRMIDIVY